MFFPQEEISALQAYGPLMTSIWVDTSTKRNSEFHLASLLVELLAGSVCTTWNLLPRGMSMPLGEEILTDLYISYIYIYHIVTNYPTIKSSIRHNRYVLLARLCFRPPLANPIAMSSPFTWSWYSARTWVSHLCLAKNCSVILDLNEAKYHLSAPRLPRTTIQTAAFIGTPQRLPPPTKFEGY